MVSSCPNLSIYFIFKLGRKIGSRIEIKHFECLNSLNLVSWDLLSFLPNLVSSFVEFNKLVFQPDIDMLLKLTAQEYSHYLTEGEEHLGKDHEEPETKRWTFEDVTVLIDLWEHFFEELVKARRSSHIFRKIAELLQQRLQREEPYSEMDVHNKIDNLKRHYK